MKNKHIEINELISKYHKEGTLDKNLISDKYHTFGELYKHRIHLFIALCSMIQKMKCLRKDYIEHKKYKDYKLIKSKKHFDGEEWDGWFIIQLETLVGQISYHLPNEYWDKCDFIKTVEKANEWDGHTSDDVLERLLLI